MCAWRGLLVLPVLMNFACAPRSDRGAQASPENEKNSLRQVTKGSGAACADLSGDYLCVDDQTQDKTDLQVRLNHDSQGRQTVQMRSAQGLNFEDSVLKQFLLSQDRMLVATGELQTELVSSGENVTYAVDCRPDGLAVHATAAGGAAKIELAQEADGSLNGHLWWLAQSKSEAEKHWGHCQRLAAAAPEGSNQSQDMNAKQDVQPQQAPLKQDQDRPKSIFDKWWEFFLGE